MDSVLNASQRAGALAAMASGGVDVLVVGGGLTGAGVAVDAATRGLTTALVESQDWAAGASSASSRLVFGWPRTPPLDPRAGVAAAREGALVTRTLAPHLVRPVTLVAPFRRPLLGRPAASVVPGIDGALGLVGGGIRAASVPRQLGRKATLERCPGLDPAACAGAVEVPEAVLDDARLVVTLVRTAVGYGALAASRASAVRWVEDGGRVAGAVVRDEESGAETLVRARWVVVATGVWGIPPGAEPAGSGVGPVVKDVRVVVRRDAVRQRSGLALSGVPAVTLVPGAGGWVLGATTSAWMGPVRYPVATRADVEGLLARANRMLRRPLAVEDVVSAGAGLRPGRRARPASVPGLLVAGASGAADYRVVAARTVDAMLGKAARKRPSLTARTPLRGAAGLDAAAAQAPHIARRFGWTTDRVTALLGRYGSDLDALLALVEHDPLLASPLVAEPRYCRAEVAFACTHEGALHLEDILTRRVRLAVEHRDRGAAAVSEVAAIAAGALGWDSARSEAEKRHYRDRVAAELDAQDQPTDAAAVRARRAAPDLTGMPGGS